jgi:hypothetical protein
MDRAGMFTDWDFDYPTTSRTSRKKVEQNYNLRKALLKICEEREAKQMHRDIQFAHVFTHELRKILKENT